MNRRKAFGRTFAGATMRRSLVVAVVVGAILNLINQGDRLMAMDGVIWWRVALTFCVPFCVASYGAYSAFRSQ